MKSFFRHLFVPHHTNNFRPRVLHVDWFMVYAVFFLLIGVSNRIIPRINPDILGFATNITVERLLTLTNQKRAEAGLPLLKYNEALSQAAAGKAANMFGENYWAHNSPSGKTPWDFIIGAGYKYLYAGENLAKNFSDSDGVVQAWMESPSHKENLLRSQYDEIGFAIVNGRLEGEETTLVVQMFGKPQAGAAAAVPQAIAQEPALPQATAIPSVKPVIVEAQGSQSAQVAGTQPVTMFESLKGGIAAKPFIDVLGLTRNLSFVMLGGMVIMLALDGIYVWRRKIVRISGRNLAHIFFLTAIVGIVWLTKTLGSII